MLTQLFTDGIVNVIDSVALPFILAKPIQDSQHVSDGELGGIGGLYFAMFYCGISIPVGWLADKTNRSRIVAAACGIWSAATMCCGLAATYLQFVGAHKTVGFGEARGVPPSYSIISDDFPTGRHGTALGLFNLGPALWLARVLRAESRIEKGII